MLACYYAAGPVGPCGIVRLRTKFGAMPVISAAAAVPGSPVVTVPIVNIGVSPVAPVAPVAPVHPTKSVNKLLK